MMVQQREELELSLSLSFPGSFDDDQKLTPKNNNQTAHVSSPLELHPMPCSTTYPLPNNNTQSPAGPKMETCRVDRRWSVTADVVEEACRVSPRNKRSLIPEVGNGEDQEDGGKKLRLSTHQLAILEDSFKQHTTLNHKQKTGLANTLGLRPRQVEVWFQNRRARTKLKQTEVDCEFLKRCFQTLTEENEKLQKEVQELRALKLSPQLSIPPTTVTICPSCEHISVAPSAKTLSVCPSTTF